MLISTAEYFYAGKRTQTQKGALRFSPNRFKRLRSRPPLLSSSTLETDSTNNDPLRQNKHGSPGRPPQYKHSRLSRNYDNCVIARRYSFPPPFQVLCFTSVKNKQLPPGEARSEVCLFTVL